MKTFYEFDQEMDRLCGAGKMKEAIEQLKKNLNAYPQFEHLMLFNLVFCYREIKDHGQCLKYIAESLKKGYFFNFDWQAWNPLKTLDEFKELYEKNQVLKNKAGKETQPEWKLFTPQNYSPEKEYPLCIVLHGDGAGCNIDFFSGQWKPNAMLNSGYLVLYVQSSQINCYQGYGWTRDYDLSRREIEEAFAQVCREYSVDKGNVILGGFSGGSMVSLNLLVKGNINAKGYILLCPDETDDVSEHSIKAVAKSYNQAENKPAFVVLEGEYSGEVPFQTELGEWLQKAGYPFQFIQNKNIGHSVPHDFDESLKDALEFIS